MLTNLFGRRPNIAHEIARLEQHGIEAALMQRFGDTLTQAEDRMLFHMNPRLLAAELGLEERPTLHLLLAALAEGLMALHWDVRCPACGSIYHRLHALSQLSHDTVCTICAAHFAPQLDHQVRVTFSVHERLRPLPDSADDAAFRAEIDERLGVVTGLAMLVQPDFQKMFPQQRLLPDESLDIARLALLFTDLAGSTALYARRGDPRAYHLVRAHFDTLFAVVAEQGGTIVKTIGDAVLAVFQTPAAALRAACAMQRAIAALNDQRGLEDDERLILKVGLHSGPCLNVTLNDRPDYFGTTVNIAARVQGLSHGNDVLLTEAIYGDPQARALLPTQHPPSHEASLKGIDEAVRVYRLTDF